jgi:hypothetical protein
MDFFPLRRTMPIPLSPRGVEIAVMVSSVLERYPVEFFMFFMLT